MCPEPKVFVGQLPFEATSQDVQSLFAQHGTIRSCQVITGPDGRSKGCAMVLYSLWAEAEQAVESENGSTRLGGSKPMVVKLADPPRRGDGPIVGIAPKKLFVGQVRAQGARSGAGQGGEVDSLAPSGARVQRPPPRHALGRSQRGAVSSAPDLPCSAACSGG